MSRACLFPLVILAALIAAVPAATMPAHGQNSPQTLNKLIVSCSSNLRAVYGDKARTSGLIGARFRNRDLGLQTRSACQTLVDQDPRPRHLLWLVYANLAGGNTERAQTTLAQIPPPPRAITSRLDPRIRANELRLALARQSAPAQSAPLTFFSSIVQARPRNSDLMVQLAQAGLLPVDQVLATLEDDQAFLVLLDLYQGKAGLRRDGVPLGPDLPALRRVSDAMAAVEDPFSSVLGYRNAAIFYGRGFDGQGIAADAGAAQAARGAAFLRGFNAWFQIGLPESYRDGLITQALGTIAPLLAEGSDAKVLEHVAQAVAIDWGGLQSVQGLNLNQVEAQATSAGSAVSAAAILLNGAQRRPSADLEQSLQPLAVNDACVFDLWARAIVGGLIEEASLDAAQQLFAAGQAAGKIGAFVGGGDMLRWGLNSQGEDLVAARDLYQEAATLAAQGQGLCRRGDSASAHLRLAWMASAGQGGDQDLALSYDQFLAATNQGSFLAAEALADHHMFGLGVPMDPVLAHDLVSKATLWNSLQNLGFPALSLHQRLAGPIDEFGDPDADQLLIYPLDEVMRQLKTAQEAGSFFGAYYLGLATMAYPDLALEADIPWKGRAILAGLDNHIGAFERGYWAADEQRRAEFDAMRAELVGQLNLTFTSARYDTVAAIAHDPARALAFYRALGPDHPTAQRLLQMDRFGDLSDTAQARLGPGPVTLAQVVDAGLADQLRPLPLHALMLP